MRIQAEANLSALIESTEDLIWSVDPRLRLITFNRAFREHFERNFGGPVAPGMGIRELLPPARAVAWPPLYERALKGEKFRAEVTMIDGRILDLSLSPIVVDGETTGVSAFGKDITDHKRVEEALKKTEANLLALIESTQDLIWAVDLDFRKIIFNHALKDYIRRSYPAKVEIGMSVEEVLPPEKAEIWNSLYARALREGPIRTEYQTLDGRTLEISLNPILVDGKAVGVSVFGKDITEQNRATQALQESESRFRRFFEENGSVMMMLTPAEGEIVAANQAACEFFGYPREQFVGMHTWQINTPPPEQLKRDRQTTLHNRSSFFTYIIRRSNGEERDVEVYSSPFEVDGRTLLYAILHDVTERKRAEKQLQESEQRYRTAFQTSIDAISVTHEADGRIIDVNQEYLRMFGFEREDVVGQTTLGLNLWTDHRDRVRLVERLHNEPAIREMEFFLQRKNGERFWAMISGSRIDLEGVPSFLIVVRDISASKATAEALRLSEQRYRAAFQTSIDAISITRLGDGLYIDCNQAFLEILGYEREEVIGKTSRELNIWADARDRQAMVELVRQNAHCRGLEAQFKKKNGETVWGEKSASEIEINGVPCLLSVTRDITHVKTAESTIRNLAFYDSLTSLPNRRFLTEKLNQIQTATHMGRFQALMFVELDHFKTLNETLSHQTGDLLLKEVAQRICSCTSASDMVCRLGGDEFAVLLDDLSEGAEEAAAQSKAVGERIRAFIGMPCLLDGRECITTASIGITVFGAGQQSADELMQEADIALYQAKLAGRDTMRFFSVALQSAVNARATLEEDMRQAIKARQFLLYYQPQVNRGRLIGAEALIRWLHPKNGMVPPDTFIPLAEETGLILPLGEWVLEAACRQIAAWAGRKATAHLTVAVNISALQFRQTGFVETVLKVLERSGANPRNLKLELTESMLVDNIEDVIVKMTALKAHGLSFSLDDFGTGYSSLAYLKRLPLDQLKIDRAFVRDMLVDVTSGAIAQTILSLGRAMGLSVVAEGVETEEQRGFLAGMGCHAFQGTLFSPPLSLEEFEAFLSSPPPALPARHA